MSYHALYTCQLTALDWDVCTSPSPNPSVTALSLHAMCLGWILDEYCITDHYIVLRSVPLLIENYTQCYLSGHLPFHYFYSVYIEGHKLISVVHYLVLTSFK